MSDLIKYDAACRALAECKAIDEVKSWADKAAAMQAYGRMAQDKSLEVDAAEIRIRAERRLGEMLAQQKADGGLSRGAAEKGANAVVANDRVQKPTLADVGISKDLSSRAQKLAAVPAAEFEAEVGQWRDRVSSENARVSARLERAGERQQRAQEESDDGPSPEEIANAERAAADDAERVRLLLESDDALAALNSRCAQQASEIRVLRERLGGEQNKNAELIRELQRTKAKLRKFEGAAL